MIIEVALEPTTTMKEGINDAAHQPIIRALGVFHAAGRGKALS